MRKPDMEEVIQHLFAVMLEHGPDIAAALCWRIDRTFGERIGDYAWSAMMEMVPTRQH